MSVACKHRWNNFRPTKGSKPESARYPRIRSVSACSSASSGKCLADAQKQRRTDGKSLDGIDVTSPPSSIRKLARRARFRRAGSLRRRRKISGLARLIEKVASAIRVAPWDLSAQVEPIVSCKEPRPAIDAQMLQRYRKRHLSFPTGPEKRARLPGIPARRMGGLARRSRQPPLDGGAEAAGPGARLGRRELVGLQVYLNGARTRLAFPGTTVGPLNTAWELPRRSPMYAEERGAK